MKKQCPNFKRRNNLHLNEPASHEDVIVYVNEFVKFEKLYENSEEKAKLPQKSTFNDNFFNQTPNYNIAKSLQSILNTRTVNKSALLKNTFF